MISREEVLGNLEKYNLKEAKIGVVASHSALDTCDGAISEGFKTVAVCQKGRENTFARYFKAFRDENGNCYRGVTNVGVHPTVDTSAPVNCETFLLDFTGEIYNKPVRVDFLQYLRPECRFDSIEDLRTQIQKDIARARAFSV